MIRYAGDRLLMDTWWAPIWCFSNFKPHLHVIWNQQKCISRLFLWGISTGLKNSWVLTGIVSNTRVCSCCLCSWRSARGTGSWQTLQSAMFLRQWISWVVKLATGMLRLLTRSTNPLKPISFLGIDFRQIIDHTHQFPQNCVLSSAIAFVQSHCNMSWHCHKERNS